MLDAKALRRFALTALLSACMAPVWDLMTDEDGITIVRQRTLRTPERVVQDSEVCREDQGRFRLAVVDPSGTEPLFRFENQSESRIFVSATRKAGVYRTDYPDIDVLFKSTEAGPWKTLEMNPASFIRKGLRRITVSAGASIVFRASISAFVPEDARIVKLQLRFDMFADEVTTHACISSPPFNRAHD